ncbi:unnamed protein product, partial [Closterium sp. NIES-54]
GQHPQASYLQCRPRLQSHLHLTHLYLHHPPPPLFPPFLPPLPYFCQPVAETIAVTSVAAK